MWVGLIQSLEGFNKKKTDVQGRANSSSSLPFDYNCKSSMALQLGSLPHQILDTLGFHNHVSQFLKIFLSLGCGEKGTLLHCWWECKLMQPLWKTIGRFLKKTKNRVAIWSFNPTPGHISRENHNSERVMYHNVHCSTIYNSQDMEPT